MTELIAVLALDVVGLEEGMHSVVLIEVNCC